jgi:hypothetical protein
MVSVIGGSCEAKQDGRLNRDVLRQLEQGRLEIVMPDSDNCFLLY